MFRLAPLLVSGFLCALPVDGARADTLPKSLGYSFYVQGEPAGRADIKITRTAKDLVFESQTRVLTGFTVMALTSRTVADPKTYVVRDFTYHGTKGDHTVSCEAHMIADSVYGYTEMDGALKDKHLKMPLPQNLMFEDWVVEHEILIALTQARSPRKTDTYGLIFTSSFSPAQVTTGFSGDILVEAGARSMTARKLLIMIQGAEPYESRVDPKTGVPVYIRFPESQTEMFLDEIFGENPLTYYQPKEKKQ
jgi:hypothetical protein